MDKHEWLAEQFEAKAFAGICLLNRKVCYVRD